MKNWLNVSNHHNFSLYNLPFGIFSTSDRTKRAGMAIGDLILDLASSDKLGLFDQVEGLKGVFLSNTLNPFIELGAETRKRVREIVQNELQNEHGLLANERDLLFVEQETAQMHMPVHIGDYTDFYSSVEHAMNVGTMFRGKDNALQPNWLHLPVGYHGRSSSIIISGKDIHRPKGQRLPKDADTPVFGPSVAMDFELEMAFVTGKGKKLGHAITTDEAWDYIFGFVLFNDWTARDIQKWEYVPLGPFLGKNFASSISPWIITPEALAPFMLNGPKQEPEVLPYLQQKGANNLDIALELSIEANKTETVICQTNSKYLYWSAPQQLAHHTVNGCNIRSGDMMASGTISGKDEKSFGSLLEQSWAGTKKITLNDGSERTYLQDGDTVIIRGYAENAICRVGFGEVRNTLLPAL